MKKALSIALALSLVTTTLLSVGRDYLTSQEFNSMIDSTDLATMKFTYNGEKITLEKYVKDYVNSNIDNIILDKASPYYSDLWFPFADALTDYTVDKVFSSDYVNKIVKSEFKEIVDYFLHSNVDEAKQRIEDGVSLDKNPQLNPENASDYEEKISAQVKLAILQYVEEESEMSCDEIIVLFSADTASTLKSVSIILVVILLLLNIKNIPNVFIYLALFLCGCGSAINYIQNTFENHFEGMQDLIAYEFLKPVLIKTGFKNSYVFIALKVAFGVLKKNKQSN